MFQKEFPNFYHKFAPEELIKISQVGNYIQFRSCIIKTFEGKIAEDQTDCVIRKLKGPTEIVEKFALVEMNAYKSVQNCPSFVKVVGFYFKSSRAGYCTYYLIKILYKISITAAREYTSSRKIEIITQLYQGISELTSNGFFHGAICPKNIFLESTVPKIDIALCINYEGELDGTNEIKYLTELQSLNLCDREYLAPEVIFALACLNNGKKTIIEPKEADLFSLGSVAYFLIGCNPIEIALPINPKCSTTFVLNTSFNQLKENLDKSAYRNVRNFINKVEIATDEGIFSNSSINEFTQELISASMKILTDERNLNQFQIVRNKDSDKSSVRLEVINELKTDFYEIIWDARKEKYNDVQSKINAMNNKFFHVFATAYENFYSTSCSKKEINVLDGLALFIRNQVLLLLENPEMIKKFIVIMKLNTEMTKRIFFDFFDNVKDCTVITQNFIIFGLMVMKFEDD